MELGRTALTHCVHERVAERQVVRALAGGAIVYPILEVGADPRPFACAARVHRHVSIEQALHSAVAIIAHRRLRVPKVAAALVVCARAVNNKVDRLGAARKEGRGFGERGC